MSIVYLLRILGDYELGKDALELFKKLNQIQNNP